MRFPIWRSLLISFAGLGLLATLPLFAAEDEGAAAKNTQAKDTQAKDTQAKDTQAKDTRPIPRLPNGKPDLSGVWDHPRVGDFSKDAKGCVGNTPGCSAKAESGPYAFTPAGKAAFEDPKKFDYGVHCLPWGYVRSWATPYPLEIMQKDDRTAILFEQNKWFHVIPTDGRKLDPKTITPTWFGTSVGHWEGDTLVVETIGTNGKTWIDTAEHPHSDALTVLERFDRIDYSHIRHQITITDPKYFTKPMTNTAIMSLMKPGDELLEYSCDENNKEVMEGHVKDDFFRLK